MLVLALIFLAGHFYRCDANALTSVKWSKSYTLKAVLTIPTANLTIPYQVWHNGNLYKSRVDFYGGLDKLYRQWDTLNKVYDYFKIHPDFVTHKDVCNKLPSRTAETQTMALNSFLPIKPWTYVRLEKLNNIETHKFVYSKQIKDNAHANLIYSIWVKFNQDGTAIPVRFVYEMKRGNRTLDKFSHDYSYFNDKEPDAQTLLLPMGMQCVPIGNSNLDDSMFVLLKYIDSTTFYVNETVKNTHDVKVFGKTTKNTTCDLVKQIDPLIDYTIPYLEHTRLKEKFDKFRIKYNKIYKDEAEYFKRMNNFQNNLRYINSHNSQNKSFTLGVNQFADLSREEMKVFLGTISKSDDTTEEGSGDDEEDDDVDDVQGVNANFDWRDYGAVTSVKDQTSMCAACYAFTAAAAIESSAYVARGCKHLDDLSEQAIIDCSWGSFPYGNLGCAGGTYEYALEWAQKTGLPLKSEYGPYLAMEGQCKISKMNKLVKISSSHKVDKKKRVIKDTLRQNGPLLAAMDTRHESFLLYDGGIYEEPLCSNNAADRSHGVTIVGYGREQGKEYWIIKNSFGPNWGEKGYMRIDVMRNLCGLRNDVYTVEFKTNKSANCKPSS